MLSKARRRLHVLATLVLLRSPFGFDVDKQRVEGWSKRPHEAADSSGAWQSVHSCIVYVVLQASYADSEAATTSYKVEV